MVGVKIYHLYNVVVQSDFEVVHKKCVSCFLSELIDLGIFYSKDLLPLTRLLTKRVIFLNHCNLCKNKLYVYNAKNQQNKKAKERNVCGTTLCDILYICLIIVYQQEACVCDSKNYSELATYKLNK